MDWEFLTAAPMPPQSHLLHGCFLEAERADRVAQGLGALRMALPESFHGHMIGTIEEIHRSASILRDIAERSQAHANRAITVSDHLNVLLPCLSRTLRDITTYYDDKTQPRELRWRRMYHAMLKESGGGTSNTVQLTLPQRFMLYNNFLGLVLCLLIRDPAFDPSELARLRAHILDLRKRRGIPEPVQVPAQAARGPLTLPWKGPSSAWVGGSSNSGAVVQIPADPRPQHWCEKVFSLPLTARTDMGLPDRSIAYGPLAILSPLQHQQMFGRPLVRWSFDKGRMVVFFHETVRNGSACSCVVVRMTRAGQHSFAWKGHHELCISQEGNELVFRRWSRTTQCAKEWAALAFITWEELVLFYCAFMSLKARNRLTTLIDDMEFTLEGENQRFQGQIRDDNYIHSLLVFENGRTGGLRLHAAVWDGVLRRCPVWTAFVTHKSTSPTWLVRISRRRILVKDIQLYVFCDEYREETMRRNKSGAFELSFINEHAADRFMNEVNRPVVKEPAAIEERAAGPSSY